MGLIFNKEIGRKKEMDIFLSYCWKDDEVVNKIYDYFKNNHSITVSDK